MLPSNLEYFTMYHVLLRNATFWAFLFRIDQKLAEAVQAEKCPSCGCHLHSANYPRKPRGPRDLKRKIDELNADLRARVETLERIVTDDKETLKRQFDKLG